MLVSIINGRLVLNKDWRRETAPLAPLVEAKAVRTYPQAICLVVPRLLRGVLDFGYIAKPHRNSPSDFATIRIPMS